MYVNGKMIAFEAILGIEERGIKKNGGEGLNSRMTYLIYYKNLCK
jgi:hypothetical protein